MQDGQAVLTPDQISEIVDYKEIGAIVELTQRPIEIEDQGRQQHRPAESRVQKTKASYG